jgi:hypothetical protein
MPFINDYLTLKYITGKEPSPREFTDSVARAMCAKMEEGAGGALGWSGAAHGRRPRGRWWLELILVTCPTLCSKGELAALEQHVEKGSAGCARTSMPQVYACRVLLVGIWTGRSLSGSATQVVITEGAIVSICMDRADSELSNSG